MDSSVADKRNFYLMLSATEGQLFANMMGFQTPSEEVQEMEIMDILSRWAVFVRSGLFDDVSESADWFVEFLVQNDKIVSPPDEFTNALTVFGLAMLNKMMDRQLLGLFIDDDVVKELYEDE